MSRTCVWLADHLRDINAFTYQRGLNVLREAIAAQHASIGTARSHPRCCDECRRRETAAVAFAAQDLYFRVSGRKNRHVQKVVNGGAAEAQNIPLLVHDSAAG